MAKRKSSKGANQAIGVSMGGDRERLDTGIEKVENGYVVSVSGDTGGKYFSKRYVANDRPESLRIAASCLAGGHSKGSKKKSSGKKKIMLKKS